MNIKLQHFFNTTMDTKFLKALFAFLMIIQSICYSNAYIDQLIDSLNVLDIYGEKEDASEPRIFYGNYTDYNYYYTWPMLFLAAVVFGSKWCYILQWWLSSFCSHCDDHYSYDSGYGYGDDHGGSYSSYKRSDEEPSDFDHRRFYQKRSTRDDSLSSGKL